MRRLLVTGSRDWTDIDTVSTALQSAFFDLQVQHSSIRQSVELVHGDARGLDRIADGLWRYSNYGPVTAKPADWGGFGKRAGFIRNSEMVALGPDLCLAFIKNQSKGATMCAEIARRAGIEVRVFTA